MHCSAASFLLAFLLLLSSRHHSLPAGRRLLSVFAPECPAAAAAADDDLGPYEELLDLERAPLLWRGVQSGMQGSAHEREGDFSAWLYEERGRLYFFDQAGPLCTTRSFYDFDLATNSIDSIRIFTFTNHASRSAIVRSRTYYVYAYRLDESVTASLFTNQCTCREKIRQGLFSSPHVRYKI